jgi:hypothetical protein
LEEAKIKRTVRSTKTAGHSIRLYTPETDERKTGNARRRQEEHLKQNIDIGIVLITSNSCNVIYTKYPMKVSSRDV